MLILLKHSSLHNQEGESLHLTHILPCTAGLSSSLAQLTSVKLVKGKKTCAATVAKTTELFNRTVPWL